MATLRGPGWGRSLCCGVLVDRVTAKSRPPIRSDRQGGIYGSQLWVDPTNRVVGMVMTPTAVIGSGPIADPVRKTFYAAN
jgi:hypothetical protein